MTISGPPGIGKSSLAQLACHVAAEQFPDGLLYLDFRSLGQPCDGDGLLSVAIWLLRSMGVVSIDATDLASTSAQWRWHLAGRRVLILMDNAISAAQVVPFLPTGHGSAAVITSPQLLAIAGIGHHLEVGPLGRSDSVDLLDSVIGASRTCTDPVAVAVVAELCGDSPAALQMAALRLVCRPDWTVAELTGLLQSTRSLFDELHGGGKSLRATSTPPRWPSWPWWMTKRPKPFPGSRRKCPAWRSLPSAWPDRPAAWRRWPTSICWRRRHRVCSKFPGLCTSSPCSPLTTPRTARRWSTPVCIHV